MLRLCKDFPVFIIGIILATISIMKYIHHLNNGLDKRLTKVETTLENVKETVKDQKQDIKNLMFGEYAETLASKVRKKIKIFFATSSTFVFIVLFILYLSNEYIFFHLEFLDIYQYLLSLLLFHS
jgi:hypothetical protein